MEKVAGVDSTSRQADLEREIKELNEKYRLLDHERKSRIIELQCELEFQKKRADTVEAKFKEEMTNNSSDVKIQQLTEQLNQKENEIVEIRAKEIEKRRALAVRIEEQKMLAAKLAARLEEQRTDMEKAAKFGLINRALSQQINSLKDQIERLKQGALSAIMEKQSQIAQLQDDIKTMESKSFEAEYVQLKDRFEQLQQNYDAEVKAYESRLQAKSQEILKLNERMESDQQNFEQRLVRLQNEVNQRMEYNLKQTIMEAKDHENSLMQNLEALQEKIRKYETKLSQLEMENQKIRFQAENQKRKLIDQRDELQQKLTEELAVANREMQQMSKIKEKEAQQLKQAIDKLSQQKVEQKKVDQIDEKKQETEQHLAAKQQFQERIRKSSQVSDSDKSEEGEKNAELMGQIQEIRALEDANIFSLEDWGMNKTTSTHADPIATISVETPQIKFQESPLYINLNEQINRLKKELETAQQRGKQSDDLLETQNNSMAQLTKQLQAERAKVRDLTTKRSELVVELESLKTHTYKVESFMLTEKMKHAEQIDFIKENYTLERQEFTMKLIRLHQSKAQMEMEMEKYRKKLGISSPTKVINPLGIVRKT